MKLKDFYDIIDKTTKCFSITAQRHCCGGKEIGDFYNDVIYIIPQEQRAEFIKYSDRTKNMLQKRYAKKKMENTVDSLKSRKFCSAVAVTSSHQKYVNEALPLFKFKKVSTFKSVHGKNEVYTWVYTGD